MKSIIVWMFILLMTVSAGGCAGSVSGSNLMKEADPSSSALALWIYDGESVEVSYIYDSAVEEEILSSLNAVAATEAEEWSQEDITLPIYGLEIGTGEGDLDAAWSGGYWIADDGSCYEFDYDFAALRVNYEWEDHDTFSSFSIMPCAYYLALDGEEWNTDLLTPAEELTGEPGITMTLTSLEDNTATVTLSNASGESWYYGEYFSVQLCQNGVWYRIPTTPGAWAFIDLAYELPGGSETTESYNLEMYGELPPGTYRLVVEELSVEFVLE